MIRFFYAFIIFVSVALGDDAETNATLSTEVSKNIWDNKNIWIKTYVNNKNYYTTINNIVKIEQKIKYSQKKPETLEKLNRRLELQKSKLSLYERNKSFETLLAPYKFELPTITAYDYFDKTSQQKLSRVLDRLIFMKNEFNKANSLLNSYYKKNPKGSVDIEDIQYFEDFSENINKTYTNLMELKTELDKRYAEYYQEKLQKHIITLVIVIALFILYKILLFIYKIIEKQFYPDSHGIYSKVLSIIFYMGLFLYIVVRYMEDFIYIITFLSVVAAALTIALREIILNLVAAIYIFFSNMLRVGDRVMVQFETKHTIGDITDISLMKLKLNEIEDYTNVKEVKSVGRTIYIPNSYVFTKVFYNYSRKKNGIVNDLIEFEFATENDFEKIRETVKTVMEELKYEYKLTFTLNTLKTGVVGLISYQTNYKEILESRGRVSIELLKAFNADESIKLKASKASS
ncbi:MAG: mechanosensitive ion channel [Campylobacterales bacterium]|nr:mechanosensitive ion channel [Campylobacterales bacterium]